MYIAYRPEPGDGHGQVDEGPTRTATRKIADDVVDEFVAIFGQVRKLDDFVEKIGIVWLVGWRSGDYELVGGDEVEEGVFEQDRLLPMIQNISTWG